MADIRGDRFTTTVINVGGSTTNSLEVVGDHDWYRVSFTQGQTITVSLTSETMDSYLRIRDADGNLLFENDDSGGSVDARCSFTVPASGTYFIDVGAYDDAESGAYQLSVNLYTPPPVGTVDQFADYLASGYWYGESHHFAVAQGGSLTVNLLGISAEAQGYAREALNLWSDIIGVRFVETTGQAQLRFVDDADGAHSDGVWSGGIIDSAYVNVSTQWLEDYRGNGLDSYAFQTFVHEIGHALGLGHAGDYNGDGTYPFDAVYENDGWPMSVMSYFDQRDSSYFAARQFSPVYVVTPMIADIQAMALLYGLSTTTRTGNTVYGFNSTAGRDVFNAAIYSSVGYTIFDNGGVDTLDYSGFSARQRIDLSPEVFSDVGGHIGNVVIARGTVIENATGGSGSDELLGNSVANILIGNAGNDQLYGHAGDDSFRGGAGDDLLDGGAGEDLASYAAAEVGVAVSLAVAGAQNSGEGFDTLVSIERLEGSSFDDQLTGNSAANVLHGLAGNDLLNGGGGADLLIGGGGNDIFIVDDAGDKASEGVDEGRDEVRASVSWALGMNLEDLRLTGTAAIAGTGNALANVLRGNEAANVLAGLDGTDDLRGEGGDDQLEGGTGNDRLHGGAGNDTLTGGSGDDRMYGGVGDDTYMVGDGQDYAYENVGEGQDRVIASVDHQLRAEVEDLVLTGTASLIGKGNASNNGMTGNEGSNRLYGYGGNDRIEGAAGDDYLVGGEGDDSLAGGAGHDRMYGGTGNDSYFVSDTADYAYENVGEGTDRVIATINHTLRVNLEELELGGNAGLRGYGNSLDNLILGNGGANYLYGRDGNDRLAGGAGNDILWGDNGADRLAGGTGQDRFYGGSGADEFIFADGELAGMTSSSADRVHDFSRADGDRIRLELIDANANRSGDQAFTFIGASAFSGSAGELRFQQLSGNTYVQGDTNGDGRADFWIRLDGLHTPTGSDFFL